MIDPKSCIVCGVRENLNTELRIVVDDKKIAIMVCDQHAEDMTPKMAKDAYVSRMAEIQDIIEKAEKLGLHIAMPSAKDNLVVVTAPQQKPAPRSNTPAVPVVELKGDNVLLAEVVNAKLKAMPSIAGTAGSAPVEAHRVHDLSNIAQRLPEGATKGKVKMTMVEGRGGQPMAVPGIRCDQLGTTTIMVRQTITDAELQRIFKGQAQDTMGNMGHTYKDGYTMHNCPLCRGACTLDGVNPCQKCGGKGFINL